MIIGIQKENLTMLKTKKHAYILLVCYIVVMTLTVGIIIDAKPKKNDDTAGAKFWDDIEKLTKPGKIIEDILKRIGVIDKELSDLEKEQNIHKAHAVSCDNSVTQWKAEKKKYVESYTAAYNSHSAASQALSEAKAALTQAQKDITTASDRLDALSNFSNTYMSPSVSDEIDEWLEKLKDARSRKSAAESDIPMQEAIIAAAEKHMEDTHKRIIVAVGMIAHFENREAYHDSKVESIQVDIDKLKAEAKVEDDKKQKILDDYDKKDEDD